MDLTTQTRTQNSEQENQKTNQNQVKAIPQTVRAHKQWPSTNSKRNLKNKSQLAKSSRSYKAIIVDCVDVLLLGNHISKASTSRILKRNARGLRTKNPIDIVPIIEFIVESFRDLDSLRRITILNDDQMVLLEERSPHLQEIEVPDGRDDDIEFIFQKGSGFYRSFRHC